MFRKILTRLRLLASPKAHEQRSTEGQATTNPITIGNMYQFLRFLKDEKGIEIATILDVGAHEGTWSKTCRSVFDGANYFLIEPQAEMEDKLKNFCSETNNSKYKIAGLGEKKDSRELTVWEDLQGTSFKPAEIDLDLGLERRKIEIETIDSLVEQGWMPVPDLVKIDVQGYEKNVIEGAKNIYGKTELIVMEVSMFKFLQSTDFTEMVNYMDSNGYVVYDIAGFHRRPYDGALAQLDVVFVRRDGILREYKKWA